MSFLLVTSPLRVCLEGGLLNQGGQEGRIQNIPFCPPKHSSEMQKVLFSCSLCMHQHVAFIF